MKLLKATMHNRVAKGMAEALTNTHLQLAHLVTFVCICLTIDGKVRS